MKYDCSDEFNLSDIFGKLTSKRAATNFVAASEFFPSLPTLAEFQRAMDRAAACFGAD